MQPYCTLMGRTVARSTPPAMSASTRSSSAGVQASAHSRKLTRRKPRPALAREMPPVPSACCVPSKQRLTHLALSIQSSAARFRAAAGSLDNMVLLEGARFHMGSEASEAFPHRWRRSRPPGGARRFYISKFAVTNERFAAFARKTGYRTEAERFGWPFVFRNHIVGQAAPLLGHVMPGTPWWVRVDGAARPAALPWGDTSGPAPRPSYGVVFVRTLRPPSKATATSGFPSRLKSPKAIDLGSFPTRKATGV